MHSTQINAWLTRMALVVLSTTTVFFHGCAHSYHFAHYNFLGKQAAEHYRPYYHSPHTGRIIAKTHGPYCPVEPPCFGFEPTCWNQWPAQCPSQCNQPVYHEGAVVVEEVVQPAPTAIPAEEMPAEIPAEQADPDLDEATDVEEFQEFESVTEDPASQDAAPSPLLDESESAFPSVDEEESDLDPLLIPDIVPQDDTSYQPMSPDVESTRSVKNSVTPPLEKPVEKQSLADQLVDDPVLPPSVELESTAQTNSRHLWEVNVPRREMDQKMVLVEETEEPMERAMESATEAARPLMAAILDSTREPTLPAMASPAPEADEPQPERLALRSDPVHRSATEMIAAVELPPPLAAADTPAESAEQPLIQKRAPTAPLAAAAIGGRSGGSLVQDLGGAAPPDDCLGDARAGRTERQDRCPVNDHSPVRDGKRDAPPRGDRNGGSIRCKSAIPIDPWPSFADRTDRSRSWRRFI